MCFWETPNYLYIETNEQTALTQAIIFHLDAIHGNLVISSPSCNTVTTIRIDSVDPSATIWVTSNGFTHKTVICCSHPFIPTIIVPVASIGPFPAVSEKTAPSKSSRSSISCGTTSPTLTSSEHILELKPIPIDSSEETYFRLQYELIPNTTKILITSTGCFEEMSRSISMEFDLDKRIDYALVAMSRVMLGRNVIVEGPIGTRYGTEINELNANFGVPLIMKNDFFGIDPVLLDTNLAAFKTLVLANDIDGDNRLRPGHPTEGIGTGGAISDYDGDQYVTQMDLFLSRYDLNGDIDVVYDPLQAAVAGYSGLTQEFSQDMQLAKLIDFAKSDRNNDGIVDNKDQELGYNDGIIDERDRYAKVDGSLGFAVSVSGWETASGESWQADVRFFLIQRGMDLSMQREQ